MALPIVPPFQPIFNYPNNKLYQYEVSPVELSVAIVVSSTSPSGISSLSGSGVANVFMHSSAPGAANYGAINPNPANGLAIIQLQNNFSRLLDLSMCASGPVTGSALTSVTAGAVYSIQSLGTTTAAQWAAKGLSPAFTATVNQSFVATATGAIGGTGTVKALALSGIASMEVMGLVDGTLNAANLYQNGGGQIIVGFTGPASSSDTTRTLTAPPDGTVIRLRIKLSNSSVTVNGR